MAGIAKPNVAGLREEAQVNFLSANIEQGTNVSLLDYLVDGSTSKQGTYGAVLFNSDSFIEFEIFKKVTIWAFTNPYSDGGGDNNHPLKISKWDGSQYVDFSTTNSTNNTSVWYKLIDELEKGRYKLSTMTRYAGFDEWYVEKDYTNKTLILHDGEYKKFDYKLFDSEESSVTSNNIKEIIASSYIQGGEPEKANDGKLDTIWHNGGSNNGQGGKGWLLFSLKEKASIKSYAITSREGIYYTDTPASWVLEASNDKVNWVMLDNIVESIYNAPFLRKEFHVDENLRELFLHYRITVSRNNGGASLSFSEFELLFEGVGHRNWESVQLSDINKDGMDSLSPLLDRRVETLEPLPMIDKSEILQVGEVGKVFSNTIDLKKYLDIRSMKVEVE